MTGKLVPCIKIDDIPGELLFVVTANNFDSRSGSDLGNPLIPAIYCDRNPGCRPLVLEVLMRVEQRTENPRVGGSMDCESA